jgi:predicted porin
MISTPSETATGSNTLNTTVGSKPRMWGAAATYTNGPLYLTGSYESHSNFSTNPAGGATMPGGPFGAYNGTDTAWTVGGTYQFGPVKAGVVYTKQQFDLGFGTGTQAGLSTDGKVSAWNIAGEWAIQGPHALRGGYTKVNSTSGTAGAAATLTVANRTFNGGLGSTGANMWQAQYVYNASKRTELTAGYVKLSNDANATYSLGGLATPKGGQNQDAFAVSIKNTF